MSHVSLHVKFASNWLLKRMGTKCELFSITLFSSEKRCHGKFDNHVEILSNNVYQQQVVSQTNCKESDAFLLSADVILMIVR